jgi:hypothetical protein
MRKERALFIIGLWIILLPFSGFPSMWRTLFFVVTGLVVLYIAYLFYTQAKKNIPQSENHSKTFIDNIGSGE